MPEPLRSSLVGYEISLERLNGAVRSFVADAKTRGWPVEQIVPELRRYLSGLPRWTQPADGASLPPDMTIIDRAVQWAIEAYFEESGRGGASSVA